jgi:hypothetical protein
LSSLLKSIGRGDRIRTCDLYVPKLIHFATNSPLKSIS